MPHFSIFKLVIFGSVGIYWIKKKKSWFSSHFHISKYTVNLVWWFCFHVSLILNFSGGCFSSGSSRCWDSASDGSWKRERLWLVSGEDYCERVSSYRDRNIVYGSNMAKRQTRCKKICLSNSEGHRSILFSNYHSLRNSFQTEEHSYVICFYKQVII